MYVLLKVLSCCKYYWIAMDPTCLNKLQWNYDQTFPFKEMHLKMPPANISIHVNVFEDAIYHMVKAAIFSFDAILVHGRWVMESPWEITSPVLFLVGELHLRLMVYLPSKSSRGLNRWLWGQGKSMKIALWPGYAIWWHRSGSTLAQVMACCLMAPSHYLNLWWLFVNEVQWH